MAPDQSVNIDLVSATGATIRQLARVGTMTTGTGGLASGYHQANLAIVSKEYAHEFMVFCHRNPKPCPLLDVTEVGGTEFKYAAPGSDVLSDLPAYCIYRNGELVEETGDITSHWRPDHVAFLLRCSFSADAVLEEAQVEFALTAAPSGRLGAYLTNIRCEPSGRFHGHMIVSARPVRPGHEAKAASVTASYPLAHGAPIHVGDPLAIGIQDILKPEWGSDVKIEGDYVPVFWACGVTPQQVAMESRIPEMITHKAGHMFVTDLRLV